MAPMLPLPMAALLSLTITFKVEKSLNYINAVVGQALENCATRSPWLSMPIIGALWTQKVCSWRDYITFDCICSHFTRDGDTISQLIRSCFASFLGLPGSNQPTPHCSLNALLGGAITGNGHPLPVGPGYIYLRTCRTFQDVRFISNFIICLIIDRAQQMAAGCTSNAPANLKSGKSSLTAAVAGIQDAVSLGASLICIAGGLRLVQVLYENTLPEVFILGKEEEVEPARGIAPVLKGYALAYTAIHCGAFVWGVGKASLPFTVVYPSRLGQAFVMHMEFIARVMDGNVRLDCDSAMWKSYVLCFLGLLVQLVPAWLQKIRNETLEKLANGLRRWDECELALQLLERGGPAALTAAVKFVL